VVACRRSLLTPDLTLPSGDQDPNEFPTPWRRELLIFLSGRPPTRALADAGAFSPWSQSRLAARISGAAAERKGAAKGRRRRSRDPREAARPVIATSGDQPHAVAVTLDANAKTVLLDFMEPLRTSRNLIPVGWETELKCLKHGPKIAIRAEFTSSQWGGEQSPAGTGSKREGSATACIGKGVPP